MTWSVRKLIGAVASEAIALVLRRPAASRQYLFPQIFAGLSYLIASLFMLELWRVLRSKRESWSLEMVEEHSVCHLLAATVDFASKTRNVITKWTMRQRQHQLFECRSAENLDYCLVHTYQGIYASIMNPCSRLLGHTRQSTWCTRHRHLPNLRCLQLGQD